jgi:hypothetical protein
MNFNNIKNGISLTVGRGSLILRKYSPEILITTGITGIVVSTVMACKATLKADGVIENAKQKLDKVHQAKETVDKAEYTEKDYRKDMTVVYIQTAVDFVKLYGPSVTLGVLSIGCILGAHGIMKRRNLALIAAYKTIEQSFTDYRKRVVAELGEDKDRQFKYGINKVTVNQETTDENGNKVNTNETIEVIDPNNISQYARFFDESCTQWSDTPGYNMMFLKCQQNYANDLLHSRGHLFLNEVYDMLGIPRSREGIVVGWVKGAGDDFVDFGIFDANNDGYRTYNVCDTVGEERRDFVNGYRKSILLDFNVAGTIYDLI